MPFIMIPEQEAQKRIEFLVGEINKHNNLYYQQAQPLISDYEFDLLRFRDQGVCIGETQGADALAR